MDPIFGLPCIMDSKAMDAARARNQSQEKKLADKFGALAVDMETRSSKILIKKGDVKDFKTKIDFSSPRLRSLPLGLTREEKLQYQQILRKEGNVSISLTEFDRRLADRKLHLNKAHVSGGADAKVTPVTEGHENRADTSSVPGHLIDLEDREFCLPINRKKHAMREAWRRANSDDIKYKSVYKSGSTSSLSPSRSPAKHRTSGGDHDITTARHKHLTCVKSQTSSKSKTAGNKLNP